MKKIGKQLIFIFIAFLIISAILSSRDFYTAGDAIPFSDLVQRIENQEVEKIEIMQNSSDLKVLLTDGAEVKSMKESSESLSTLLKNYNIDSEILRDLEIEVKQPQGLSFWMGSIIPVILPFLIIGGLFYFIFRQVQGANHKAISFGQMAPKQSNGTDSKNNGAKKYTFKNVAGNKEAKEELEEVVEFLKNPKKFLALGASIPKGVLLVGPPGTGKTLLARAVSNEAEVPFFHISGSEFIEMFVGVGASRVRSLFQKAKKNAPCIIFVDELDAIGRKRGAGMGGVHEEREQTLNQILVEMDGFETDTNVIVIAATNRPDVLDHALLRPGRFDRRVVLELPDISARQEILKVHSANKPLHREVNLRLAAQRTPGFSGADLANLINEAALLTARRNKKLITMEEIMPSIEKVLLGPERKSKILNEKEKKITAYHEAGHALVAHIMPHADPVHKISIISRGQAGGYTLKLPSQDKYLHTKVEFLDDLAAAMGGYAAEITIFGQDNVTTGATADLKHATGLARRLITQFGMSKTLGPRVYGKKQELRFLDEEFAEQKDYSEKTAYKIDQEISELLSESLERAFDALKQNKDRLEEIAQKLIKQETIEKDEFEKMMK